MKEVWLTGCPQRLLLKISCASRELLARVLATLPHRQIYRVDEQGNISHVVDLFRVLFVQWLCKCHAMLFSKSTWVVGYQEWMTLKLLKLGKASLENVLSFLSFSKLADPDGS